jgi:hypothetical protein
MAAAASIPRSRGSISGLALILLGAWGGIAPYAGPTFGYGFTPDQAWAFTQGRLVLSAAPGAIALVAGLGIAVTRSRGLGGFLAVLAALSGAWLIVGGWALKLLPASVSTSTITMGTPIGGTTARQVALSDLGVFWGVGALIVFFAALALGRFSLAAPTDSQELDDFMTTAARGGYQPAQGMQTFALTQPQHAADPFAAYSANQYPSQYEPEGYPGQYPSQYPAELQQAETRQAPGPYSPGGYQPGQYPSQYPPEQSDPTGGPDLTIPNPT